MTRGVRGRDDDAGRPEPLRQLVRRIGAASPRPGEAVHLYLDVSGSQEPFLEALRAAVRGVSRLVWRPVHLFATDVVDVPVRDLAKVACQTTGGTSLLAVARHIRRNGVRRAVIVTDGEVGPMGTKERETLGETILGVALTSGREEDGDLARLARHVVVLPGTECRGGSGRREPTKRPGASSRAGPSSGARGEVR